MQPVLGEQTEKGRKVTTSMGEEIEVRTESERGGRKHTFPLAISTLDYWQKIFIYTWCDTSCPTTFLGL